MQNDSGSNRYASSVDTKIASLGDWRGECLSQLRTLIHEALPEVKEECKWIKPSNPLGVIVWSQDGMICTGESYKEKVKLTFLNGAAIDDPQQLFNASLEGKARRAIDIAEGGELDALAFQSLIRRAAEYNRQR
ncbi:MULTISPECIES: DUF1801 domain-containing protein [Vibrio]|uniref:YdhG-like domain-containing protein n=1 Tax=Vibrio proteolyticus NBRC 13287 TaxID=1219065 RepID=U3A0C4_VIBPR|nr:MULTISPECIES: DUF1801 domain-containing protein [Vibrio]NAW55851.1 DUF1801 domain-containing protein [Vibrio sp. V36_P2S2PM302]NAX23576.1 DUF1801 domain-containing protein [Vibrio sp. V39_P1S14PM300]NAX27796.1 DUF1801 domain-containing protein [Vibrio sp. V38_P2S17PM301]NAX29605.1 DUF1801 domain-containing protein [Vibrio sp. V37_P2S8PM304]GAD66782.1 hypothetical protein VPR01S_05_00770 [Vibrio proteolyticus NBRC 13287]